MARRTEVVVVGGGYAGVMAANRLTQRDDVAVTLVNDRDRFVERMRLHQLAAGTGDALVDYRRVLSPRVDVVADEVTLVDAARRSVTTATGRAIRYDHLVYAVGSGGAPYGVPGVVEHAHPVATLEGAKRLRAALGDTATDAPVTVVGAGVTGLETAAELAETGRPVTLACGEVLGRYLHPRGRRSVAARLARLGVTVLEGPGATVTAVEADAVRLAGGRAVASAVTVWAAGFAVPDLARSSGLRTDTAGRLLTDETLTSVDDVRIVGAGDAVAPSDLPYRMSAYAAQPLGAHAADTVLARIGGREPEPVSVGFFGLCVGLGRGGATLQVARTDDTATGLTLSGRLAALLVKEGGTRGVLRQLGHEARRPGSFRLLRVDGTRADRVRAWTSAASADWAGTRRAAPGTTP